jgi:uncharacterized protein YprB with RNaseH-like and TPR domain
MVPLDKLDAVTRAFGIHFVVFENVPPIIEIQDSSCKFRSYKDIKREIVLKWKVCYPDIGYIRSDRIKQKSISGECCWITYDDGTHKRDFRRYVMMYNKDHYDLLLAFVNPKYCDKCGSTDHASKDTSEDQVAKAKCLSRLYNVLEEEAINMEMPPYKLVFFDFETFIKDGYQHPYMVAFIVTTSTYKIVERKVIQHVRCELEFIDYITKNYKELKYLIGFNSASFDNFFVMRSMIKLFDYQSISSDNSTIYKNKILKLNCKNIITWDLNQFTKCKLKGACEAYGIDGRKGEVDHKLVTEIFDKYKSKTFESQEYTSLNIQEYCMNDVELTMKLFIKIYAELHSLTGLFPLNYPTLPSLIYKDFDVKFEKIPFEYDDIFTSIPGGRVQAFETGQFVDQNYSLIDINSAYGYICINNEFGYGPIRSVSKYNEGGLYICLCDVDQSSLPIKLVGYKTKKGRNVWTDDIVHDVWLQPEEIQVLEQYECPIVKKWYIIWEEKGYILKDKMEYLKRERMQAKEDKNKVREMMTKLETNGFTGKAIEKNHDEAWRIVRSPGEYTSFVRRYKESVKIDPLTRNIYMMQGKKEPSSFINKPRHIGSRIYALSRLHLWRFAMRFEKVLYCAVDSLIVPQKELANISEFMDEREYGYMKLERTSRNVYIIGPHNYRIGNSKMSLRNYRDGDIWNASNGVSGNVKNEKLYKCLLDPNIQVTTTYNRMTKKFVMSDDGKYRLRCLNTNETTKIL